MTASSVNPQVLHRAKLSVFLAFYCFGITSLTLLSRLVKISDNLGDITQTQTGLLLLGITAGDICSSLTGGMLLDRYPTKKVLLPFQISASAVLILLGWIIPSGDYFLTIIGFFCFGLSLGAFNVGINIAAVTIEKTYGRVLLPRFHAFYSMGAASAALISTVASEFNLPLQLQFGVIGVITLLCQLSVNHHILDEKHAAQVEAHDFMNQSIRIKIKRLDLSILLLAAMIIGSNLAEGAVQDWLPLSIAEAFPVTESAATVALGITLTFSTLMRFFGTHIIELLGKRLAMRLCLSSVILGILLCCLSPWLPLVYVGAVFWGIGMSLGYPIGVSVASSHEEDSGFRTSLMATIGSILGIAAPPLFGMLGDTLGLRTALLIIIPLVLLGLYATKVLPRTENPPPSPTRRSESD
jgi:MFS family permease